MRSDRRAWAALAVALVLAPALARAAGYGIYEQGAAALGMAGAHVAAVKDATAQFYNPAALVTLEKPQLAAGGTWLRTQTSFAGTAPFPGFGVTEEMVDGNFFPPHAYWAAPLGTNLAYGIGINAPFGLGVEWQDPERFTGRERVTKATLETLNGSGSIAWAPAEAWSVAGGLSALFARVELRSIGTFVTDGGQRVNVLRTTLESEWKPGIGFHLAVHGRPTPAFRLGAAYRSRVEVQVEDGTATFEQIPTGDPALDAAVAASRPANQGVSTELVFPGMLTLGFAWDPFEDWTVAVDGVWTEWSAFERLPLRFAADPSLDRDIVENYDDTVALRLGAEHRLTDWAYRFGYYFDPAAAPVESVSPLLPDAGRHGVTLGLGLSRGAWTLDAYNLFLFVQQRSTEQRERDGFDGTYKSYVNALGATVAYHW